MVEGYFDCLKVHQAGFPFVVALMGTVLFQGPEKLLVERFRRAILMLDGDDSGRQAATRIAAQLTGKCAIQALAVPADRQPDQLNEQEIRTLMGAALGNETR